MDRLSESGPVTNRGPTETGASDALFGPRAQARPCERPVLSLLGLEVDVEEQDQEDSC